MVKVQRTRRSEPEPVPRRVRDIYGLLLFFAGASGLLCLLWPQPGVLPLQIDSLLRLIAGAGAYAIPLLLIFAGIMFLKGYERLTLTLSSLGSFLLFLVFVTGRHLALVPSPTSWNNEQARQAGGWLGGLFGASLYALVGPVIAYVLLLLPMTLAVILLVDAPLLEIIHRIRARGQAAQQELADSREKATALAADRKTKRAVTADLTQAAIGENPERAERAARVVERALTPAAASKTSLPTRTVEEPDEPNTTSKLFNLFSITRGWGSSDADEAETVPPAETKKAGKESSRTEDRETLPKVAKATKDAAPAVVEIAKPAEPPPIFTLPPLTLLKEAPPAVSKRSQAELTDRVQIIERTLEQFNIGANVVEVASGPSVTRYEIQLAPGIKVNKIVNLADNLAMSLAAIDVRIEAPIPGKAAIGVEVPNATPMTVSLRECLDTDEFRNAPSQLTVALGKDVAGQYRYADLKKMPHLLIGGSTNSGKSVCLNVLIASLVYRGSPRDVRMLMIDPKRVELSLWDGIPHLMHPVVKDVKLASGIFRAAIKEMDKRYDMFAALGTRNIDGYNEKMGDADKLPYIVLIVDELADLMMQQGPEIEQSICRLAQLARATGIHLVIATQRPSVDIITGTIKANISSRVAFAVASQVDSRTILDMTGAERLIGRGDMLFMPIDAVKPLRIQGCYLSESETNTLVTYLKEQEKPEYTFSIAEPGGSATGTGGREDEDVDDALFEQAVRLVVNNGQASTSMLQRRFRIGYTRAARIVEMMQERGIVGPLNGAKPREILVSKNEVERLFNPAFLPGVDDYEDEA